MRRLASLGGVSSPVVRLASAWLLGVLAACASFAPPGPEWVGFEGSEPGTGEAQPAGAIRSRARVELESAPFGGQFDAVRIHSGGPDPSLRLQLLFEVGGKALDLAVDGQWITARLAAADQAFEHRRDGEPPPRHWLVFLAASALEDAVPVSGARIRGVRQVGAVTELRLAPVLEGLEVTALFDRERQWLGRDYRFRGVTWTERREDGGRTFAGRGFRLRLSEESHRAIAAPPARLFRLAPAESEP
jgi:hypothetical protein